MSKELHDDGRLLVTRFWGGPRGACVAVHVPSSNQCGDIELTFDDVCALMPVLSAFLTTVANERGNPLPRGLGGV